MIDLSEYGRELLAIKANIKQSIRNKGVEIADDVPFSSYPAKIAAIQGGGAIPLAEYDMSALQDNSVIAYMEAVPEGYVQVRIEGTGAMMDYSDQSPLLQNPMLKKIIVKEGVTTIGNFAFAGCTNLTSVVIPDSVTTIGDLAFSICNPDLILKPEALEKPEGWSDMWNAYDWDDFFYTVWWGGVPPQQ